VNSLTPGPTSSIHDQFEELAAFNSDPGGGGITREVFTPEYMESVDYVAALMSAAGLEVRTDEFANLFGRLEGSERDAPYVLTGSHIDTTLNAGRYDGVLGVLGAIAAVRELVASGVAPRRSIEVVAFAGEEPRFVAGCLGSRVLTGTLARADLDNLRDRDGVSLAGALLDAGLDPDRVAAARLDPQRIHCFVELHIEQGGVLEQMGVPIGVVTHIAAPHDLLVTLRGAASHAGATPMTLRRDAFSGAAEAALELERLALASPGGTAVATIGVVRTRPGAINVIPGEVELEVDVRDRDAGTRTALVEAFTRSLEAIAARRGLELEITTIAADEPAACSEIVVGAARRACAELGVEQIEMVSGAYHDAMVMGRQVPIGMVFVPSVGGISHSPLEFTAPEDLERGVAVLARTLAELTR
jgi:hydantoinase/carbamoylase family amidase